MTNTFDRSRYPVRALAPDTSSGHGRGGRDRRTRFGVAVATVLVTGVGFAVPGRAAAVTSGPQTFDGVIVATGASGSREVVNSVVVAKGAYRGAGRIVEVESLPTDPENVNRDDLVFPDGTMHIAVTNVDFQLTIDPRSCVFTVSVQQTGVVEGGTGLFTDATGEFTGTVSARGVGARGPDGSCLEEQAPRIEVDKVSANGTLTF